MCHNLSFFDMVVGRWLASGNPTLLRLGNSNEFDYTRLNRSVSWLTQNREFKEVKEVSEFRENSP